MELQTAFETRRSIRHYDAEKKVTKEQVETLIKAASLAPSWKNTQTSLSLITHLTLPTIYSV